MLCRFGLEERMIFKSRLAVFLRGQRCFCGTSLLLAAMMSTGIANAQAGTPQPSVRITLDQAEQMALTHNRTLRADLMLISESKASEITAGLRPNPVFDTDAQFIPFFSPSNLTSDYMDNSAQFDAGLSYKFELYGKRKARIRTARSATVVTTSLVNNDERRLRYAVATQFISVLYAESKLRFAEQDLATFDKSLSISQKQYQAGSISHGNLLKLQLQRLLFQTDLTSAKVAVIEAKNQLRQLVGFDSIPQNYDVIGRLQAPQPKLGLMDLEADALKTRPDLQAARQLILQAKNQYHLAKTYAHPDLGTTVDYTHLAANNDLSAFATIGIPIFNRNQGNIAEAGAQITQAQEQRRAAEQLVLTQVRSAYARQQSALQVVDLYRSGYLKEAQQSLSISEYAYLRGDTSLLNFLDAERSYRTVELNYRRALAKAMLSEQRVEESIGMSLPSGKVH
jgi:cobalt-zinc-cadmium efflux system outer membrane protein